MTMYRGKIEAAKAEALDFIGACDEALTRLNTENEGWKGRDFSTPADHSFGSPETGALRRKSMDLTRILAELRK